MMQDSFALIGNEECIIDLEAARGYLLMQSSMPKGIDLHNRQSFGYMKCQNGRSSTSLSQAEKRPFPQLLNH